MLLVITLLGIVSKNATVWIAGAGLLALRLWPGNQLLTWTEQYGLKIGVIILTMGVLAPVALVSVLRQRDRRLGIEREGLGRRGAGRQGRSRSSSTSRSRGSPASSAHIEELLKESFERITALYESGADITGIPSGYRDARQAHVGLPARQPDHRRGAPEHGQVGVGALHGGEPRGPAGDPRGPVHARDVEDRR